MVIVALATYNQRQKYKIKSKVRRTSTVFDVGVNEEALPQEFGKAKKLRIHSKHVPDDIEQVPLYHGIRGSLTPPEDGEGDLPYAIVKRDLQNPLFVDHEAVEVNDAELDATASTKLISDQ